MRRQDATTTAIETVALRIMKPQYKEFSGYILAGGKSSRMGRDKAFLEINGKTFLKNALDILKPICGERVKIVLSKEQTHFIQKLPEGLPHIFDIYKNRGPLGGIHAALSDCKTEFAVLLAVDLPNLGSAFLQHLCKISDESSESNAIIPCQKNGGLQPLAAVYRVKGCQPYTQRLLEKRESASVRAFLELLPARTIKQVNVNDETDILLNVNRLEDFAKLNVSPDSKSD